MTNEELDRARVDEAIRNGNGIVGSVALIAARLAREGWTPPVAVDPDIAEAEAIWFEGKSSFDLVLEAIKRGRELERAEAKPGLVWVKHDGASKSPVAKHHLVMARFKSDPNYIGVYNAIIAKWSNITHYAVITQPEEK